MCKFFVFSDAHSHLTTLKASLDEAGFDPNNDKHYLISVGDLFDRGSESQELFYYIMSLERKIIVKGNHDILLDELCMREFPYSHDIHNGTVKTVNDIGGASKGYPFDECCQTTWNRLSGYRHLLVNYFETENYIFVHSWIPTKKVEKRHPADKWIPLTINEYMEDWRNANDVMWEEAMWGNPFKMADEDLNKTNKTIVFGHWHCSTGHRMLGKSKTEFEEDAIWEPCYYKNTIGIDRCTAHTGKVNVIVIEDNFLEGENK